MQNGYKRQNTHVEAPSVPITVPPELMNFQSVSLTMADSKETTPVENNSNQINITPQKIQDSLKKKPSLIKPDEIKAEPIKPIFKVIPGSQP